eukprot:scaffold272167_cov22-Tisochrysis_lutea.AAC.1
MVCAGAACVKICLRRDTSVHKVILGQHLEYVPHKQEKCAGYHCKPLVPFDWVIVSPCYCNWAKQAGGMRKPPSQTSGSFD